MINNQSCSEFSLAQGESLRGTAPRVDFWILLEYTEMWGRDPIKSNTLPTDVQLWINRTLDSLREVGRFPRVQMIRGNRAPRPGYSIYFAQSGQLRHHTLHSYDAILDLDIDQDIGDLVESNTYFVCTHGTRDLCCAKHGYRTWTVLNELSNGRAWQCSHLGGHRFAPNILVLPQARLYGRVHAECATNFFRIVEERKIATAHLRGRSEFLPEEQVRELGIEPARDRRIEIRESCSNLELKTVFPFTEK